jgi:hypothetical protein
MCSLVVAPCCGGVARAWRWEHEQFPCCFGCLLPVAGRWSGLLVGGGAFVKPSLEVALKIEGPRAASGRKQARRVAAEKHEAVGSYVPNYPWQHY